MLLCRVLRHWYQPLCEPQGRVGDHAFWHRVGNIF